MNLLGVMNQVFQYNYKSKTLTAGLLSIIIKSVNIKTLMIKRSR